MKTALTLASVALAIIWIRSRRPDPDLVDLAGKVGGWIEEEWPG